MQLARKLHEEKAAVLREAVASHKALLATEHDVVIYTDGSGMGKSSVGGWGVVCVDPYIEHCGRSRGCGSYGAEVEALLQGMRLGACLHRHSYGRVLIRSDNDACVKGVTLWLPRWIVDGWKGHKGDPVAQDARWKKIHKILTEYPDVFSFEWVKGHSGDTYNERADVLAGKERKNAT